MHCREPFPDKGKPTARWGRKALDQAACLIAGLPKEGSHRSTGTWWSSAPKHKEAAMFSGNRLLAGTLCRAVLDVCVLSTLCLLGPSIGQTATSGGTPDPTLLPVPTTASAVNTTVYNSRNVPGLAAGATYLDPATGVKVYKVTSSSFPVGGHSGNWGHSYAEGNHEISLPHTGTTRTIHAFDWAGSGGHWFVDFTPGRGFSNPRQLTGKFDP